jgi:ATP-dependent helicase/nuclease subunit A
VSQTPPSSTPWTDEQLLGISTVGHSLLVSAAAGSGKTAVLAERCAHLVCSAKPPCDVNQLLVVTFTRAAAAEMRTRIESAIRKRLDAAQSETEELRLSRQVALLDRASIGTLHSFCVDVLREHFHLIGLDPGFELIDENEMRLLRLEVVRNLFADRYDDEHAGDFQELVDQYAQGNDEILVHHVLATHDLLSSVVDPAKWRTTALDRIINASQGTLAKSDLGKELAANLREQLADIKARCVMLAQSIDGSAGLVPYAEHINDLLAVVQVWEDILQAGSFDGLADAVRNFKPDPLPRVSPSIPRKQEAHDAINAIKKLMSSEGPVGSLCQFSEAELKDGLERTIEPTRTFLSLVEDFSTRYETVKRTQRQLDFADLERLTLNILSEGDRPSPVARLYHRRYQHVLVDEYQDINEVQDRILSLISRESALKKDESGGNLFCVGDVKQSIYRFRLAQPEQFRDRAQRFGRGQPRDGGQVIDLRTNFRSRPELLECLNGFFERLMTEQAMEIEYDQTHRLHPPTNSPYSAAPCDSPAVSLHLLPPPPAGEGEDGTDDDRSDREANFIAGQIRTLIDSGAQVLDKKSQALRPAKYGDMAILLRAMQVKAGQFASALRNAGIPVHSDSSSGFFESTEIRDMLALLAVLDNQQQDIPLAALLRSPLIALRRPEDTLASARLAYHDGDVPFHTAITRFAKEHSGEMASELAAAVGQINAWRDLTNKLTLADALWTIYDQSNYLTYCSGLSDGEQAVANLHALHEHAKQFDDAGQRQGLGRFMAFLDSLRDDADLGQPSVAVEGDNAVRIMTIHKSKGLEFPIVFVPDLGKRHNLQSSGGPILIDRKAYIGLAVIDEEKRVRYPSLAHRIAAERIRRQILAEELRVLYVATTRAGERLFLIGTTKPAALETWQATFTGHVGPLPPQSLVGALTQLDWIGPAAVALAAESPHLISIYAHEEADLVAQQRPAREARTALQQHLATLTPLDPPSPINQRAQNILNRLDHTYPFTAFTKLPAARSVSQLAAEGHKPRATTLPQPRTAASDVTLAATEIGDATHNVMEHLDFSAPADATSIAEQLRQMVGNRFLTQSAADSVDRDGIAWFLNSELGQLLRQHITHIRREVPVSFAQADANATDPRDRTMIRGRIDLLLPLPDRCILIDYKTDRIPPEAVARQVDHHRTQLTLYATALESILHRPVTAYLAFLTPRQIARV